VRINQPMTGCCFNQQMMGSLFQSTNEGESFQSIKWEGVVSINKWWGVVSMMFGGLNRGEEENAWTKSQECWLLPCYSGGQYAAQLHSIVAHVSIQNNWYQIQLHLLHLWKNCSNREEYNWSSCPALLLWTLSIHNIVLKKMFYWFS
jgi:hypothetical protein